MEGAIQDSAQAAILRAAANELPPHLSLVDELADLLSISRDSAYRRIRGETELSLREAHLLANHFSLSLDAILKMQTDCLIFRHPDAGSLGIGSKLKYVYETLGSLEGVIDRELIYFSLELPVFHLLQVPALLSFKLHYWESIANPAGGLPRILIDNVPIAGLHLDLVNRYIRVPSTEIISEATLATTLRQILYFMEVGAFVVPSDGVKVLEAVQAMVEHLRRQAALGRKFLFGSQPPAEGPSDQFKLFHNEIIYSQNIAYLRAQSMERVFLEHNITHFLHTDDPHFCRETYSTLQTILQKSLPISHVAERERNKFFNRLEANVAQALARATVLLQESP